MGLIYAVGDIHGRFDLLEKLHQRINFDHSEYRNNQPAMVVYLGDYIDGGAESIRVLDCLQDGLEGFETVCLLGNHEDLLLSCLETDDRMVWNNWLNNGGEITLKSLDISLRFGGFDPKALNDALGAHRIAWLRSRPLYHQTANHLFVHAGIAPGIPIERQERQDLLWIRSRFLNSDADHGITIVHGHTPSDAPVIRNNRICLDIGATSNGRLAAGVFHGISSPEFLTVEGPIGKGD